jgi:uncharacterized repeat protein (TIGR03803 family)
MHSARTNKLAAAVIRAGLALAVVLALLLIAARPAQAQETVLYTFTGGIDGANPTSRLTFDSAGNLYGTTYGGGLWGYGTVFELSPNGSGGWNETVLYSFTGGADGANPNYAYVMFDSAGNLYGTTYNGGISGCGRESLGCGVVFELSPVGTSWTETVLHTFAGGTDGTNAVNGLVMDGAGNLYGKTNSYSAEGRFSDTVFELTPSGGGWTNQVIASLGGLSTSGLTMRSGSIYTTSSNGVFEVSPNGNGGWQTHRLYTFSNVDPVGTLAFDQWGNIYGTAAGAGRSGGMMYTLTPPYGGFGYWTMRTIHSFVGGQADGANPAGGLLLDVSTTLYGATYYGGEYNQGTVFTYLYDGNGHWYRGPLWSFNGADGDFPNGDLIFDSSQNLYGTTLCGGGGPYNQSCYNSGNGVVFELNPYHIANTATTLTSSPNPSTYGQAVTFTAVVTPAPPDGETVSFQHQDGRRSYSLGSGALSGGSASVASSGLPPGTVSVVAVYGGDSKLIGSTSKAVKQGVTKAATTTALASSPNPSNARQSVTFTANVTPQFGGTVTGTVVFYDGTTKLGPGAVKGGAAKFTTKTLTSGPHTITATYDGSTTFTGSTSAPVNQVVLVSTITTLSSSPNPSTYGQAVTFTATVTPSAGAPPPDGETVSFMKGTTVLGTGTLSGGSASFTTSTLPAGTNGIKAVYGGDSNLPGSTSNVVKQVVSKATTTTVLASSQNPSTVGQSVTFTASVAPELSGTVKGTVTFYDGTTALKTVTLSGGAAKFTTSTLASGSHTITATYNGSSSFTGSSASLTQTVN